MVHSILPYVIGVFTGSLVGLGVTHAAQNNWPLGACLFALFCYAVGTALALWLPKKADALDRKIALRIRRARQS